MPCHQRRTAVSWSLPALSLYGAASPNSDIVRSCTRIGAGCSAELGSRSEPSDKPIAAVEQLEWLAWVSGIFITAPSLPGLP